MTDSIDEYFDDILDIQTKPKVEHGKAGWHNKSGHLSDQIMKHDNPKKGGQLSLFEGLEEKTIADIKRTGVDPKLIVEGVRLTPKEHRLVNCFCKMLHHKSQTQDPSEENYYTGDGAIQYAEFDGGELTAAPRLKLSLYEIAQEYTGKEHPSGDDISEIKKVIIELSEKRFLCQYTETVKLTKGGYKERKIQSFRTLLFINNLQDNYYSEGGDYEGTESDTDILLSPIFRRQIDSKFIRIPNDLHRRTRIAFGNAKVSGACQRLIEYLLREISGNRYNPQINLDNLYWTLDDASMKASKIKRVKDYLKKALSVVEELGLVESWEVVDGAQGQKKMVFKINKDFS